MRCCLLEVRELPKLNSKKYNQKKIYKLSLIFYSAGHIHRSTGLLLQIQDLAIESDFAFQPVIVTIIQ